MNITTIEGINSFFYYQFDNKKYYLFGDIHGNNKNICHNHNCDYFSYKFDEIYSYYENCTSIGVLLYTWLKYNSDFHINTDIYIEESFTKNDYRVSDFDNIINNRSKDINTLSTIFPYKDMSWLEMTNYILKPCLGKNKLSCPYNDYIHIHYVDIRALDKNRISPFYINDFYYLILENNNISINDIINIIKTLIINYYNILDGILLHDKYNNITDIYDIIIKSSTSTELKLLFINKINMINNMTVNRYVEGEMIKMHRVAAELLKLKTMNVSMYNNIITFIYKLSESYMNNIIKNYDNDSYYYFKDYIIGAFNNIEKEINSTIIDIYINHYLSIFTVLSGFTMDAYLLSRLFTQINSEEIIIYTGSNHIDIYVLFFKQYLNQYPILYHNTSNNKCISSEKLPLILNANKYRNYTLKK